jgi:hypothetical protein
MVARAEFDTLRTLDYTGISGTYAAVGTPTTVLTRLICFSNATEGDVVFSNDATNDKLFVAEGNFKLLDIQSNANPQFDDRYVIPVGTQWYVKQLTAPLSGAVYIEILY